MKGNVMVNLGIGIVIGFVIHPVLKALLARLTKSARKD